MLYDNETDGHDSQVESITVDVLRQTVSLALSSYPSLDASDRVAIEVTFNEVTSVNTLTDLVKLADNHSAGNVAYWHIQKGPGTSYFYLVQGCLVITARSAPTLSYR